MPHYSGYLEIADMNNDGLNDVMVLHNKDIAYFKQNANGTLDYTNSSAGNNTDPIIRMRIGDMNDDGLKDLVLLFKYSLGLHILYQNNDDTFSIDPSFSVFSVNGTTLEIEVFDATNDGLNDIVLISKSGENDIYIYPQNESGTLDEVITYDLPQSVSHFTYADFNNDGLNDIAVIYSSSRHGLGVLYQTTEQTFADPVSLSLTGNSVRSIKSGDINNDGLSDIIIFNYDEIGILTWSNRLIQPS